MARAATIILACVQLLLAEGRASSQVESKNGTATNSTRRILFGSPAKPKNYPFMVRLLLDQQGLTCGASIISNHWVMTASHCTYSVACNGIRVMPAVWNISEGVYAAECFIHEQYRGGIGKFEYDISLLRVDQDILQDGRARAVPFPQPGTRYPPGTPATLLGWGKTEKAVFPRTLLHAEVLLENWDTCNAKMRTRLPGCTVPSCTMGDIPLRVVCTQGLGPAPPSNCFGDSGGPLIVDGLEVGVFSFLLQNEADGLCRIGAPSGFTSVVDYLPWIYRHIDPSIDTSGFPLLPEHTLN